MASNVQCPKCQYLNPPEARYCTVCRFELKAANESGSSSASASSSADVFARRVPPQELSVENGRFVVPMGFTALVIKDDSVTETYHGPAAIDTSSGWWGRTFGQRVHSAVILVKNAETLLEFFLTDLYSQDPVSLRAYCRLVIQLKDPHAFARNVLRDRTVFAEGDVRDYLNVEMQEAAQVFIAERTVDQIDSELKERRELFGIEIGERMRSTFASSGIDFLRVQILNVFHPRLNESRKVEEELFLGPGELDQRKRLFDLYDQQQLAEIAAEDARAAHTKKRSAIRQRLAALALNDKLEDIRSEEEFSSFLAQIDRDRLLRDDETAQFRAVLLDNKEDRERQRARVVALARLQDEFDVKEAEIKREYGQDQARLQNGLALARQETLGRLEIEQTRATLEFEHAKQIADNQRAQRLLEENDARQRAATDAIVDLKIRLDSARNQADIARLQIDLERAQDELDLTTLARVQAIHRSDREDQLRIERENQVQMIQARLDAEERQLRLRMEEKLAEFEQKRSLAELPLESQLGMLDPANAQIVAKLLDTRELKGMTPEQLEVVMAERGPGVVEVVKMRYEAILSQTTDKTEAAHLRALLDVLQKQRDDERTSSKETLDRFETQRREEAERQERLAGKAFDSLTDVAKSFAQRPESGVHVLPIGPGTGGGAHQGSSDAGMVQVCPKCQLRMPVGTKFCSNCGHRFFD